MKPLEILAKVREEGYRNKFGKPLQVHTITYELAKKGDKGGKKPKPKGRGYTSTAFTGVRLVAIEAVIREARNEDEALSVIRDILGSSAQG